MRADSPNIGIPIDHIFISTLEPPLSWKKQSVINISLSVPVCVCVCEREREKEREREGGGRESGGCGVRVTGVVPKSLVSKLWDSPP